MELPLAVVINGKRLIRSFGDKKVERDTMRRILLADDHPLYRKGLRDTIKEVFKDMEIDEVGDGKKVLNRILTNKYDAIILDISMPGRDGLEVLKTVKEMKPEIKVIILTMHSETQYAAQALKAGASGYFTKDINPMEFIRVLPKILKGEKHFSAAVTEQLAREIQRGKDKKPHEILAPREFQVMRMLATGKRLTNIAEELSLSLSTVSTYRRRALQKMGMKSNADIVRYVTEEKLLD